MKMVAVKVGIVKLAAFVFAVLGVALASLFTHVYIVPQLRSFFEPHPWSLYPPPSEHVVIVGYTRRTGDFTYTAYHYSGTVQARKFQVIIDSFSEELKLFRLNESIKAPYVYEEIYRKVEGRPVGFAFIIVAPNKPGVYEINLRYIVFQDPIWLSWREYKQKVMVRIEPFPYKLRPEETLTIILDSEVYRQGDTMIIKIKNISNETQWFTNAAYDIIFLRFDPASNDWVFHIAPIAADVMTPLRPQEEAQITWRLEANTFPAGRYRVGTKGVYAEFKVK